LFAVVEPLTGNVAEPLVCGKSAGLSPVAVVVAASFWTWLWGPLGLLLSTPLTLCLVVFARHVDRLKFIDVMLGDQPALTPQQTAYQRMLTGDPIEAIEQSRAFLKEGTIAAYYEEILLGALRLAEADAALGRLDDVRLENIHETVSEILEDIASYESNEERAAGEGQIEKGRVINLDARKLGKPVFCIPGLGRLDDCAAMIVADALKREGYHARVSGADTEIDAGNADTVCVCFLGEVSEARAAFTVRKLSRTVEAANVIICAFARRHDDQESAEIAPRSLAAVISEIGKSATGRARREQ
jgi:hypothetical protein